MSGGDGTSATAEEQHRKAEAIAVEPAVSWGGFGAAACVERLQAGWARRFVCLEEPYSAAGMFSFFETNGSRIRVYGLISWISTSVRIFFSRSEMSATMVVQWSSDGRAVVVVTVPCAYMAHGTRESVSQQPVQPAARATDTPNPKKVQMRYVPSDRGLRDEKVCGWRGGGGGGLTLADKWVIHQVPAVCLQDLLELLYVVVLVRHDELGHCLDLRVVLVRLRLLGVERVDSRLHQHVRQHQHLQAVDPARAARLVIVLERLKEVLVRLLPLMQARIGPQV